MKVQYIRLLVFLVEAGAAQTRSRVETHDRLLSSDGTDDRTQNPRQILGQARTTCYYRPGLTLTKPGTQARSSPTQ
jgi:hypothetical protein